MKSHALALANAWRSPRYEAPEGHPALDLLMRREPNLKHGRLLAVEGDDYLPALIHAVESLDHSVLAVQGPPGSGKTYLGSRTIAHLVAQGKRIGVVAGHADDLRKHLDKTVGSYNAFAKSLERNLLTTAAEFPKLDMSDTIADVPAITSTTEGFRKKELTSGDE